MSTKVVIAILAVVVVAGAGYYYVRQGGSMAMSKDKECSITEQRCKFRRGMDKLWSDHVVWTRQVIVSALADLPDTTAALTRLLKNQEDLGNAIVPFYGADAGTKLTALLKDHINIAVDLVKALKSKATTADELDKKWHANAVDIASFLSAANPSLPKDDVVAMLNTHLALTSKEVAARLNKDWETDVKTFDEIFEQAILMAKTLSDAIALQFPEKFS